MTAAPATSRHALHEWLADCYADPLLYVLGAFPWGEGQLAPTEADPEPGPDDWQVDVLNDIRDGVLTPDRAIQIAVASGHGIGKTSLIAWIILWFISTRPHPQIVVTANTSGQLATKTWREVEKWRAMAVNGDQLKWTATKLFHKASPGTWFASAIPWSEHNSEAFAGTHERDVLLIFDEASRIADVIWEVSEGAMTTSGAMWICFGNPTQNTGRFFESCFGRLKHRWRVRSIDSRTAKMTDKSKIQEWIDDYGEDSDFVRVRVRGVPPRSGIGQLIPSDAVEAARMRDPQELVVADLPLIIGADIARDGDDMSVFAPRRGPMLYKLHKHRIGDLMRLADVLARTIDDFEADACAIDATGMGAGVYDRLVQLNYGRVVHPIVVGERADDPERFYNRRAEIWWRLREWITGLPVSIPVDIELETDLTNILYTHDAKERIQLERKKDMKERGLASPDCGDALALTHAVKPRTRFAESDRQARQSPKRRHSWRA